MENYVGKICPFCKTPIKENEIVKVCPSCNIPHHVACWTENKGCTTFGCNQQMSGSMDVQQQPSYLNYQPAQTATGSNVCSYCGTALDPGVAFCPKCGGKAGGEVQHELSNAIQDYNHSVNRQNKSSKMPVVIVIIFIIMALAAFFVMKIMSDKKAEEAKEDYLDNAKKYAEMVIDAGVNLEDISDTVCSYWYDYIYYDAYYSIESAVADALSDKDDAVEDAEVDYREVENLYKKLKKIPDEVKDEDRDDLEPICDAVKDMQRVYEKFYSHATDPDGSYKSYSSDNSTLTEEMVEAYEILLDELD